MFTTVFIISYFPVLASSDCNDCLSSLIFSTVKKNRIYLSRLFPCLDICTPIAGGKMAILCIFRHLCKKLMKSEYLLSKGQNYSNFNLNHSVFLICYDFQTIMTPNGM